MVKLVYPTPPPKRVLETEKTMQHINIWSATLRRERLKALANAFAVNSGTLIEERWRILNVGETIAVGDLIACDVGGNMYWQRVSKTMVRKKVDNAGDVIRLMDSVERSVALTPGNNHVVRKGFRELEEGELPRELDMVFTGNRWEYYEANKHKAMNFHTIRPIEPKIVVRSEVVASRYEDGGTW